MKLRCYCCGGPVRGQIALVSLADGADRVFIFKPEHAKRAEKAGVILVRREK